MSEQKQPIVELERNWWQSPLGQCLIAQEKQVFKAHNQAFHGYYQLQIGGYERLLPAMTMPKFRKYMTGRGEILGNYESLPFKSNCIDTLLLSHVLEFSEDPHQILREADRVVVGDGTVIICCFNPWSLWGLRNRLWRKSIPPWHGHFFGKSRIKDWLALLNFDVVQCHRLMFRPPIKSDKWLARLERLENLGQRFWPILSGVTILVASKRTVPLTPVSNRWSTDRLFAQKGLVTKPATRQKSNG